MSDTEVVQKSPNDVDKGLVTASPFPPVEPRSMIPKEFAKFFSANDLECDDDEKTFIRLLVAAITAWLHCKNEEK